MAYHIKKNKNTDNITIADINTADVAFAFSPCKTFIASPYCNYSKLVKTTTENAIDMKKAV